MSPNFATTTLCQLKYSIHHFSFDKVTKIILLTFGGFARLKGANAGSAVAGYLSLICHCHKDPFPQHSHLLLRRQLRCCQRGFGPVAFTPLPRVGSSQPAAEALVNTPPWGGRHAAERVSSRPEEWVSGPLHLR